MQESYRKAPASHPDYSFRILTVVMDMAAFSDAGFVVRRRKIVTIKPFPGRGLRPGRSSPFGADRALESAGGIMGD